MMREIQRNTDTMVLAGSKNRSTSNCSFVSLLTNRFIKFHVHLNVAFLTASGRNNCADPLSITNT